MGERNHSSPEHPSYWSDFKQFLYVVTIVHIPSYPHISWSVGNVFIQPPFRKTYKSVVGADVLFIKIQQFTIK